MLRFVPNTYREKMERREDEGAVHRPVATSRWRTSINTLEANVDEPIIERGNDARMSYGDRFTVTVRQGRRRWKLKDLD